MVDWKYRTRGRSSPQGKPKVYFCCHPEDFDLYFDAVAEELLARQNCSIWYPADVLAERDEEFLLDLKQMQLFVMPVTSRLLRTANRALDEEFRLAVKNHIPVLPLMQESGLEELFNQRCGDLQFLDKNDTDITAICYEEKLEKYLASVLIGDALAEKIRAAFAAYVFLSYRKKDRRYAQELMRLIHKNDLCRDVAIWYDEFLVPGENFNESIKAALQKSGLFVLTVTPNLVNEINYVMTTEYPMAKQEGKPVLPVELVSTDREQLAEKYKDVPACTNAYEEAALSAALTDAVGRMSIRENDTSPEHVFFMGLAYLGGVDVEVDFERAAALITSAAEDGFLDAVSKLVEMYRNGIGVARSYRTAILWQERKAALLEAVYKENPDVKTLNDLFWAVIDCGNYYAELGELEKAKENYRYGLEKIEGFSSGERASLENLDWYIQRNRSAGYDRIGNICREEGQLSEARGYYRKALEIRRNLAEKKGIQAVYRDLPVSYIKLGGIYGEENDTANAKACYEKAQEISAALLKEEDVPEISRYLAVSCAGLGDICRMERKLSEAYCWYQRAIEVENRIAEETGTIQARRDLAYSCSKLGTILQERGSLAEAKEYYKKCHAIRVAAAEETDAAEERRGLLESEVQLGDICQAEGKLPEARSYYRKALEIGERIVKETGTAEARRGLAVIFQRLGNVCVAEGDLPGAEAYFRKDFDLSAELAKETGTVKARRDLAVSCEKLGDLFLAEKRMADAEKYYRKALELRSDTTKEIYTIEARNDLAISCIKFGDVCREQGDLASAKTYFQKAIELSTDIVKETDAVEMHRILEAGYAKLGSAFEAEKSWPDAEACYQKALAVSLELAEATDTPEARRDLAVSYGHLGDLCYAEGKLPDAARYYQNAADNIRGVAEKMNTADMWTWLAIWYYKRAMASEDNRRAYLKKCISVYEMLEGRFPEEEHYGNMVKALRKYL